MMIYVVRRFLGLIPTLLGVSAIVFVLFNLVGGDPTYQMLGRHASAQQIQDLRRELGLDQSKWAQFGMYLKQVATFDFGRSYKSKQQISEMILNGMGPSLMLAVPAFFFTVVLALAIAVAAAYLRGTWWDRTLSVACVMGMSVSALVYILFGQKVLAYEWGWFPISGFDARFPEGLKYVLLPALIWVVVSLGSDVRYFRNALLDEVSQDYVRTARAKGLAETAVFFKHVLKNALIPVITYVVIEIPFLMMGSFLLETFFGIPGLGSITVEALTDSDFPVLKAMVTLFSILFVLGQAMTDILYTWVDPRVRLG